MKRTNYYFKLKSLRTIVFAAILCIANNAISQESDSTESPYFTVFCNDTSVVGFPLLSTNVKATISGVIANIEIEQVYQNSSDSVLDATYVFPMSTNAAIYSMQMIVNERVIDAVIKRKQEAQNIFDTANANGYTATLLEQHRPNVFQMSVANINPGDSLSVKMVYTELIEPKKGVYQFVLPSIVWPRFTNNGEDWIEHTITDSSDVRKTAWNIDLKINAGMNVSASCKSHTVSFTDQGKSTSCYLETNPGNDFIVDYTLCGNIIKTGLLLYEGVDENFFLSIIQPPKPEVDFESPKREYVFIMDVSGSMSGTPIEVSKSMITNLLNDLNPDDKFNILLFAGGSSVLSESSLPVTIENIQSAIEMIDETNAGGSTQLLPAMERALAMEGTANYARTFVILTDGHVTVEKQTYELIRENLNEANFFSFGIGTSVNREIIEGMAYVGEGESFVVTNNDDAYEMADTFKEYIESPALTNIVTEFSGINVYDVEPLAIPDVFAERPIIIYGKYDNATGGSITLSGDYADGNSSKTLNFNDYSADADKNKALVYLWARKRIKLMSDYGIASNENDTLSIEEEITQLGLKYSLITEYTSFVAVDSSSITSPGGGSSDDDDDEGDGWATEIDESELNSESMDANIIQIVGKNILSKSVLNFKISGNKVSEFDEFVIRIVDINGQVLLTEEYQYFNSETIISINLGDLAKGLYFINLSSGNKVIDSEKFILIR